jgi:Tol biopolymer transport system component
MNKYLLITIGLTSLLGGCSGYPRLLSFPFDPGGKSFNSLASELNPQITSSYIVFISDRNGSPDVYVFDLNSRRLIDLPGLNALDEIASDPSISEDGRYLVFAGSRLGKSSIYLYDRDTQQKRSLSDNIEGIVRNPTISADGSTIAFEVATDGHWDLVISDRSGKQLYTN